MIEPEVLKNGDFKSFQEAINNIGSLKTEAKDYIAIGTVYDHYRYRRKLLASAFSFVDVEGNLAACKLRCDQGFLGVAINPNRRYDIRDD